MLSVRDLKVAIKGFPILRGVSFEVPPQRLIALSGRNGAGKTTTLKSLMGLVPGAAGKVSFTGVALLEVAAHRRPSLGLGYAPEDRRLIAELTVEDNLRIPAWAARGGNENDRLAYIYGRMPEVAQMARRPASSLSGGQQKMVAVARALMSGTRLLLLDEPFEGLSPASGDKLEAMIRTFRDDGLSILLAQSDMRRVRSADRTYVIERGRTDD